MKCFALLLFSTLALADPNVARGTEEMHSMMPKPYEEDLDKCAKDLAALYKNGFDWNQIVAVANEAENCLSKVYQLSQDEKRIYVKHILERIVGEVHSSLLPSGFVHHIYIGLLDPVLSLIFPAESTLSTQVHDGKSAIQYAQEIAQKYSTGFYPSDLTEVVEYSVNVAKSCSELNAQEKENFSNQILDALIDETDVPFVPDLFVDWIFKKVGHSMIAYRFLTP